MLSEALSIIHSHKNFLKILTFIILVYDDKRNNFSIRKSGYKLGHFVVVRKFKLSKQKKLNICATHITTQNVIRAQIR